MELLIETYTADEANLLTESTHDGKNVSLSGIFMQAETKNRNGRIYKLDEMVTAVQSLNESIKQYGAVGAELDHPEVLTTNLKNIAALITECRMDGNNAVGKMRIIDTPYGMIAKTLINSGLRPGVSSRGAGNVGADGTVSGFIIQSIDLVSQPSCQAAQPLAVFEGLEMLKSGNRVLTLAEQVQHDDKAQKYLTKELFKYLDDLTKYKK